MMADEPVDVNNPILPAKHRDRWLKAVKALHPRMPGDLTPDELREAWGEDLAAWFEKSWRNRHRTKGSITRRETPDQSGGLEAKGQVFGAILHAGQTTQVNCGP